MVESITETLLKKLKPDPQCRYDVRDKKLTCFLVRVFPSGKMSYRVQYARNRNYTLGDVERFKTVAEAREEARKILGDFAKGTDPIEK